MKVTRVNGRTTTTTTPDYSSPPHPPLALLGLIFGTPASSSAALVNRNLQGRAAAEEEKLFVLVRPPKNKFHQIMRHLQCATSEGNNFSGPAISLRALWREYSRIPIQLHLSIKFSRLDFLRGHREFFSYCLLPKKRRRSRTQEKICTLA